MKEEYKKGGILFGLVIIMTFSFSMFVKGCNSSIEASTYSNIKWDPLYTEMGHALYIGSPQWKGVDFSGEYNWDRYLSDITGVKSREGLNKIFGGVIKEGKQIKRQWFNRSPERLRGYDSSPETEETASNDKNLMPLEVFSEKNKIMINAGIRPRDFIRMMLIIREELSEKFRKNDVHGETLEDVFNQLLPWYTEMRRNNINKLNKLSLLRVFGLLFLFTVIYIPFYMKKHTPLFLNSLRSAARNIHNSISPKKEESFEEEAERLKKETELNKLKLEKQKIENELNDFKKGKGSELEDYEDELKTGYEKEKIKRDYERRVRLENLREMLRKKQDVKAIFEEELEKLNAEFDLSENQSPEKQEEYERRKEDLEDMFYKILDSGN